MSDLSSIWSKTITITLIHCQRIEFKLYHSVVMSAWPDGDAEKCAQDQTQLEAAAWKLLSEREANEDKQRLTPDKDLPKRLLVQLAAGPGGMNQGIRLVRQLEGEFEFVHDQMNAYLAGRWLTKHDRSTEAMEEMLLSSKLWNNTKEAQRPFSEFVADMLEDDAVEWLWSGIRRDESWRSCDGLSRDVAEERGVELKTSKRRRSRASA